MTAQDKPVAIVLGGTTPHSVLLQNLSARGYFCVLLDYLDNPPAKAFADQHVQESTLDKDTVVRVAREMNAKLVISTCVDQANTIAVYAAEQLGLPHPYSFEDASIIADKTRMKEKLAANDIPTARHILVETGETPNVDSLTYPLVVKPADTNGSAGVRRVDTPAELDTYLKIALNLSRVGRAIVEEFVVGPELSIDCFIEDGNARIVLIRRKYEVPAGAGVDQVMQSVGSIAPFELLPDQLTSAEAILGKMARAFNLDNSPMLVQAFLTKDGISIIEFAARLSGGTGSATTKLISGFDALDASIDSFLGVPVKVDMHPPALFSMTNTIYANPGEFDRIDGIEKLIEDGIITQYLPYRTRGTLVGTDMSTKSRIGAFLVTAKDMDTLRDRLAQATARIDVYDTSGNKIMRKDLIASP